MAFVLWTIFSRKGRARQFGGEFVWSSEPYVVEEGRIGKQVLIVHRVQPSNPTEPPKVGLEYRATAAMAASMVPLSLTVEEARQLARDLEHAASAYSS